ncbi:MAG: hypothetical protein ACXAES_00680 [Promethearchaeota archaeon]|jgi:enoyl-CoA hydratase/carnithine racemase
MKEYKTINIEERQDGISIITLNRPNRKIILTFMLLFCREKEELSVPV